MYEVVNPATEQVIAEVELAGTSETDADVDKLAALEVANAGHTVATRVRRALRWHAFSARQGVQGLPVHAPGAARRDRGRPAPELQPRAARPDGRDGQAQPGHPPLHVLRWYPQVLPPRERKLGTVSAGVLIGTLRQGDPLLPAPVLAELGPLLPNAPDKADQRAHYDGRAYEADDDDLGNRPTIAARRGVTDRADETDLQHFAEAPAPHHVARPYEGCVRECPAITQPART